MNKGNYKEIITAYSILGLVPPLGMLFIIVGWFKGERVDVVSVMGMLLGIILTIVYYLQLTNQF